MTDKIYILIGATGSYDTYEEWYVCASFNKELLEYHKLQCEKERDRILQEIHALKQDSFRYKDLVKTEEIEPNKFDEHFQSDDSSTGYHIKEIKMLGEKKDG